MNALRTTTEAWGSKGGSLKDCGFYQSSTQVRHKCPECLQTLGQVVLLRNHQRGGGWLCLAELAACRAALIPCSWNDICCEACLCFPLAVPWLARACFTCFNSGCHDEGSVFPVTWWLTSCQNWTQSSVYRRPAQNEWATTHKYNEQKKITN